VRNQDAGPTLSSRHNAVRFAQADGVAVGSNSDLARRKPHWIDFDAGACLDPGRSVEEQAVAVLSLTPAVAPGEQTRNGLNGNREIAFWKRGVTL
jgi:altronate hydrolase